MSYIQKSDNIVVNAKLTSIGRKLLASGALNYTYYALGDSEIDYRSIYDLSNSQILRPKDSNPDIKCKIPPISVDDLFKTIPTIIPVEVKVVNTAKERGLFTGTTGNYSAQTNSTYCYSTGIISGTSVTGGTSISIENDGSLISQEPGVGTYMLVKWLNPAASGLTTGKGVIDSTKPVPYLFYKIQSKTGTLTANTLSVTVDRTLPNFSGLSTSSTVIFYPSGDSINTFYGSGSTTPYWNENTLAFNSNCNIGNGDVPVWNMNIVYTNTMEGIDETVYQGKDYYGSTGYTGFKQYIGSLSGKSVGIIHYTNHSISNYYGESLNISTPVLELPTIMYDNSTGTTIGLRLVCDITKKSLSGFTGLTYYSLLVDGGDGSEIGKVFNDLKVFAIEDQEIIAAMSYKSNRNWTLPKPTYVGQDITLPNQTGLIKNTEKVYITYLLQNTSGYTQYGNYGLSTGLHCQSYITVTGETTVSKNVRFYVPPSISKFMRSSGGTISYSGNGFTAQKIKVLVQKATSLTQTGPTSNGWKEIDITSKIQNYATWSGSTIDPTDLSGFVFSINGDQYTGATAYNLNNYITVPVLSDTTKLQFGEETVFFGNIKTNIQATVYKTRILFEAKGNEYNVSVNPTWIDGNSVYIDEVGIYDIDKQLVAVGKLSSPIEKKFGKYSLIDLSIDF
jgi:hypothetical protein